MLNEHDEVSLVSISNKATAFWLNENVSNNSTFRKRKMYPVTMDNKMNMLKFIDNLNSTKEITNHSFAFQYSFGLLKEIFQDKPYSTNIDDTNIAPVQMLYISRGLLSPLTEAKSVLESIAKGQSSIDFPVIINTCAIILGNF